MSGNFYLHSPLSLKIAELVANASTCFLFAAEQINLYIPCITTGVGTVS